MACAALGAPSASQSLSTPRTHTFCCAAPPGIIILRPAGSTVPSHSSSTCGPDHISRLSSEVGIMATTSGSERPWAENTL
eukprot:4789437-Prymnesium_polylepis.1